MRYYNRQRELISRAEWRELTRNRDYCLVKQSRSGARVIITSWIGVAVDFEDRARPFLLQLFDALSDLPGEELLCGQEVTRAWFATEDDALATHTLTEEEEEEAAKWERAAGRKDEG